MCGIIAIVRRRSNRPIPDGSQLLAQLGEVVAMLPKPGDQDLNWLAGSEVDILLAVDRELRGEAGLQALLNDRSLSSGIAGIVGQINDAIDDAERLLDEEGDQFPELETINASLVRLKDAAWSLERDRLRAAREVTQLGGTDLSPAAVAAFFSIQQALSNLDRLEVRGRDSAGLHILVRNHGLDLSSHRVVELAEKRTIDPLFQDGSVRAPDGHLGFVYKAAAEIGELGDNTAAMRRSIASDELLHLALEGDDAEAVVLAHTRWASVGIISEPNAHPVNSDEIAADEIDEDGALVAGAVLDTGPYVTSVLNGDVDNFADLIAAEQLSIASEITTDAKVIPAMVSRGLEADLDLDEAVRSTVAQFEGSVAIGISTASAPGDLHLALRGSGQGVFVGLAEDAFVVASEPYGVVEDSDVYLRMDGETPADPDNPTASQGQILRLSGALAGQAGGVTRFAYDGTPLPIGEEWKDPDVTTRDIDRGDAPHFLLKEISESPLSFRKTLRGRLVESDGTYNVNLPAETMPETLRSRMGGVRRVLVIGQGTAAVAGQAVASAIGDALSGAEVPVEPITATELSGFHLGDDMSDTLVVAISQSGTTTDTNRTVDLARSRGASVIAIVNRRGSDLVDKADGVLYTSDGRDVEMSVASTKAFYAQIAAGFLLADALADQIQGVTTPARERQAVLAGLVALPDAMIETLALRPQIGTAASRHAPSRRYWAMVGNGANAVAAREVRIKLSELCYKSIACDITEDKKHIDLSSEPLILVCAAGLTGSNADDVAKEVAIFKAHKAAPIVVATEGEHRFSAALDVIGVPEVHPKLAFVLSTIVGHLFGYEAALAIDASARPLREARGAIEGHVGATSEDWFEVFGSEIEPYAAQFFDGLRAGSYNGHLEASTAVRLAALLRFAARQVPLDSYQVEMGKVGTPGVVVEDLAAALTACIEELTRPIDAIKHQAKTVTVGISRADESLLQAAVIQAVLGTGCPRDRLSYRSLRTLAAISPAVASVVGYTRYRVEGAVDVDGRLHVIDKGGVATGIASRVDKDPTLRGTKHRVVVEREPFVTVGTDGRVVLIVPEVKDEQTTGLTLCHLQLNQNLGASTARTVLQGYRNRYRQLFDVVTERQPTFREDLLADVSTVDLLTAPISDVAANWIEG
ncbi:MAG: SIS domain-containing protein [Actinomycetia bacterium]|nr:SIS domain-containing protein [Actinomycetes bacterium]